MLFKLLGFHGNKEDYANPLNNFFTDILSTKCGNPLSLGLLYSMLARSLEVPIYGVNLPGHFILCYLDYTPELEDYLPPIEEAEILFYINPFNQGSILTRDEIDAFLVNQELPQDERFYRPCSNLEIISRMMNNLIHSYIAMNRDDKVRELQALQSVLLEQVGGCD
jgi:regulator of sirC expression with transglutaminase-like and TPR domain